MTNEGKVMELIFSLQKILEKHEITHLDLAFMVSSFCEEFTNEETDVEPETFEKYTRLQTDVDNYIWNVLTTLADAGI
ncbi:hypothetical protein [Bacillus sp. C1]